LSAAKPIIHESQYHHGGTEVAEKQIVISVSFVSPWLILLVGFAPLNPPCDFGYDFGLRYTTSLARKSAIAASL
jgi:hypothetical protein